MTPEEQIAWIVDRFEGPHSNDPTDRGGETFWGVTLTAYRDVYPKATLEDLRRAIISLTAARRFYWVWLFGKYRFGEIPDDRVRLFVLDYAINSGPRRAIKALQRAVAQRADGVLGPHTLGAVRQANPHDLQNAIIAARLRLLAKTPEIRSIQRGGWLNRIADLLDAA